jgi:hypothetical protein
MGSLGRLVVEMFARAMGVGIAVAITCLLVIGFVAQSGALGRLLNVAGLLLLGGIGIALARVSETEQPAALPVSSLGHGRPLTLEAWRAHDARAHRSALLALARPARHQLVTSGRVVAS